MTSRTILACFFVAASGCAGTDLFGFDTNLVALDRDESGVTLTLYPQQSGGPRCPTLGKSIEATMDSVPFTVDSLGVGAGERHGADTGGGAAEAVSYCALRLAYRGAGVGFGKRSAQLTTVTEPGFFAPPAASERCAHK